MSNRRCCTDGWTITTLGEVTAPTRPRVSPTERPDLPFIGMEHVEPHTMKLLGTVLSGEMKSGAIHFQSGDVLYGRLRPYLNKVYRPEFEGLCSAEFIVLPGTSAVESTFLQYFLNSSAFVAFASRLNEGDRPRVDFGQIASYPFALPSIAEQCRIVDEIDKQLSRLDAGVAALKRVQANLKRYRAAVLKAACEGRLVPTEAELARKEGRSYEPADQLLQRILVERRRKWGEDELAKMKAKGKEPKDDKWKARYQEPAPPDTADLPELPEGWCWATVGSLSGKVVDGVHKKPSYVSTGVPFVTVRNLTAGPGIDLSNLNHITYEDHAEFCKRADPEMGDILVSKDGTLGVTRLIRTKDEFSIFVSVALVKPTLRTTCNYIAVALTSPQVQVQMVPKGSGLQHIHLEDLRTDCIPLPPLNEQNRITTEIARRLSLLDELQRIAGINVKRSERLRQSVLKRAFEGKLLTQDPNDQPVSTLSLPSDKERRQC